MAAPDEVVINSQAEEWPRRLLHVPTLTSFERQAGNIYGHAVEPEYNILSYTWGRWQIPNGPALPVKGVTWKIPSISEQCFTVEEFKRVLTRVAGDGEYVWVDVACIDQERYDVKMDEVGRQAGIFQKAKDMFIWLHSLEEPLFSKSLTQAFDCMDRIEGDFEQPPEKYGNGGVFHTKNWADVSDVVDWTPPCLFELQWAEILRDSLATLIADPWFSSMWTLQESYIAPDADLLPRDGPPYSRPGFRMTRFMTLIAQTGAALTAIEKALSDPDYLAQVSSILDNTLHKILDCVHSLDHEAHDSPVMLYTSAGRRTCQDPLDRIYAIMQVFGFKLGASRDPTKTYSLPDLELEFGLALNNRSPLNGQLFTHLIPAQPNRSWMITQSCEIPNIFHFDDVVPRSTCSISPHRRGEILFKGKSCSFASIGQRWLEVGAKTVKRNGFWAWKKAVQIIVLDHSSFNMGRVEPRLLKLEGTAPIEESDIHQEILEKMLSWRDQNLRVLQLGRLLRRFGDDLSMGGHSPAPSNDSVESDSIESPDGVGDPDEDEDGNAGLVVRQVMHHGAVSWERVGVAVWRQLDDGDSLFNDTRLLLC